MFENDKRLYISKNLCPPCNGSDINRSNILRHGIKIFRRLYEVKLSFEPSLVNPINYYFNSAIGENLSLNG